MCGGFLELPHHVLRGRIYIHACHTCGGVILFELLVDDTQLLHAPESLEREVYILVVEVQEFS